MKAKVNLEDVIEAITLRMRESNYFYSKKTGVIFMITDYELMEAERDPDINEFPEWQQESIKVAVDILSTFDYIKLPEDYEIDDYDIMKSFCYSIEDSKLRNKMCKTIQGRGAFSRFKNKIHEYDIVDEWYDFQDQKYREIAIRWCERHDIEYKE